MSLINNTLCTFGTYKYELPIIIISSRRQLASSATFLQRTLFPQYLPLERQLEERLLSCPVDSEIVRVIVR